MNPQLYGTEHLIYIATSLIIAFLTIFLSKKFLKEEKQQTILIKIMALILFLTIFFNRIALVFEYETPTWSKLLTDSFCSTSSYVLSLSLLFGKKNNIVLHFVWLISLVGGVVVTFYSDFIGQNPSFLYPPTILGMIHHTLSALVVIVILMFKYVHITYKKSYVVLFGFAGYFLLGLFMKHVFNYGNPFYMYGPAVSNTPLTVWVLAPIYIVGYSIIIFVIEIIRKYKSKKETLS